MTDRRKVRVSKFLALVLRHDPARIGIELDPSGWAGIDELLAARHALPAVLADGLRPMARQYVHLSGDEATALEVGRRHGHPVVLAVDSQRMYRDGHDFFVTANGVWLTERVPPSYLRLDGEVT